MKNRLVLIVSLLCMSTAALAQSKDAEKQHRVVFHLASADTLAYLAVVRQINNMLSVWPTAKIEVLANNQGVNMFRRDRATQEKQIQALIEKGIVFAVCQNSMRSMKLTEADMLKQATYVPAGVVELVLKQEEGWSYIKAGQ